MATPDFPLDELGREYDEDGSDDGVDLPLPDGIKKEILAEAATSEWKQPGAGDEVTIHYVGKLESGAEFASSRIGELGEPYTFVLGKADVVKAWDLGVPTMRKGEVAKFTVSPEYAYGHAGKEKVPPDSTLSYEIELLAWTPKFDLFSDGTVIKTVVQEGSGWKSANMVQEVCLSFTVQKLDGSIVQEFQDTEYLQGSELLGPFSKAVDRSLMAMKKGEVAQLEFTKDFDPRTPEAVTATLTLHQMYETKDVSFMKDRSLMKKQVVEGEGENPKDGASVKLLVGSADGEQGPIFGFQSKVLEFTACNGEVADALELCVAEMKKGEKAILRVLQTDLVAEPQLGLQGLEVAEISLTLVLEDFDQPKHAFSLSGEEKMERAAARKEVGTRLFKAQRFVLAARNYQCVADMLAYAGQMEGDAVSQAQSLKLTCELNRAACLLKLRCFEEARGACSLVLKSQSSNLKALFRKAQAEFGLNNFSESIADCKRVLQLDTDNRDAKLLLRQAVAGQKEAAKKSKEVYASMFGQSSDAKAARAPESAGPSGPSGPSAARPGPPAAPGLLRLVYGHLAFFLRLVFGSLSSLFGRLLPRLRDD